MAEEQSGLEKIIRRIASDIFDRRLGKNWTFVTTEEALTKRCCGPQGCGGYTEHTTDAPRLCIADKCMAWRRAADSPNHGRCALCTQP